MRGDMDVEQRMRLGGRGLVLGGDKRDLRYSRWNARGGRKLGTLSWARKAYKWLDVTSAFVIKGFEAAHIYGC